MGRGLQVGFGAQPYTLICAPGAFNLLGYDALLPNTGALKGYGLTGLPGVFAFTGGGSTATVGGLFPAATPTFNSAGGTYENAQRVTITCSSPGTASIYYTTDGSTPTTSSTPYPGTINVPTSATLKAIAIVPGFGQSAVGTAIYTITLNLPAGAAALGYTVNQFSFSPQFSDIAITLAQWESGAFKLANKYYGTSGPGWTDPTAVTTAQGVMSINLIAASGPGGAVYGQMPVTPTGGGGGAAGTLGYLVAANGFYCEFHEAVTNGASSDVFEALWLQPQEHTNGNLPYLEVDVQEGNYSTNHGMFPTVVSWKTSGGLKQLFSFFTAPTLDRTQFHRYGVSYDPIGKAVKFYCDDVLINTVSTNQTDVNGVFMDNSIKSYHYYMIATAQSHGASVPYSMMLSNMQAWIPPPAGTAPTQVQLLLQGQTSQGQGTDQGGINRFSPQNANYSMIGWQSVASATAYNIYRATIPVGSQATGVLNYTLYATVTAAAAASAYSGYVSGSGSSPHSAAVNCAYGDSAATGCVNGTRGGGTGTVPTAGDLWAGTGYSYKVSAIVGGVEGPQSAAHFGVYISNGVRVLHQDSFNNEPNTAATNGGVTPTGNTLTVDWSELVQGYFNPYSGNGATEWSLNIRQWNYLEIWDKCSTTNCNVNIIGENENDILINGPQSTAVFNNYATWVPGSYVHFKIPLADFWTDSTRGRQNAWYKVILSKTGGTSQEIWFDHWIFTT